MLYETLHRVASNSVQLDKLQSKQMQHTIVEYKYLHMSNQCFLLLYTPSC